MQGLLDTAGKQRHRGKLNCVGLVLINSIISNKIASHGSMEYRNRWLFTNRRCQPRGMAYTCTPKLDSPKYL